MRGLEPGREKDPTDLPALCPAIQSQTPIPLDLDLDHTLHLRKGLNLCQNICLMQHLNTSFSRVSFSWFLTGIPSLSSLGIVLVSRKAVPAPHPVPLLGPLPLCPAPLPGGGGTHILPLVLAHGVAPGRVLDPLIVEHSGVEAEDCTGTVY